MTTFSTLCFGSRNDADWWRRGLKEKSALSEGVWVKKTAPSNTETRSVLNRSDSWLYLGGHFSAPQPGWGVWPGGAIDEGRMYNDPDDNVATPPTREVLFRQDHALVRTMDSGAWTDQTMKKGGDFKQTGTGRVILFGGCAIARPDYRTTLLALQALFDDPLILGWSDTTGRQIINLMLGGDGVNDPTGAPWSAVNFWSKLGTGWTDRAKVRQAWLAAAAAIFQPGDPTRKVFAVVDSTHIHSLDGPPVEVLPPV